MDVHHRPVTCADVCSGLQQDALSAREQPPSAVIGHRCRPLSRWDRHTQPCRGPHSRHQRRLRHELCETSPSWTHQLPLPSPSAEGSHLRENWWNQTRIPGSAEFSGGKRGGHVGTSEEDRIDARAGGTGEMGV